jgi:hypothetical protein
MKHLSRTMLSAVAPILAAIGLAPDTCTKRLRGVLIPSSYTVHARCKPFHRATVGAGG